MTDRQKLQALHRRLLDEQRRIILAAAEVEVLPSTNLLARISDLENAIVAVEAMIEDSRTG